MPFPLTTELNPSADTQTEVEVLLKSHWHSTTIVSKDRLHDAAALPRVVALNDQGKLTGLATFLLDPASKSCELVSLNAEPPGTGLGGQLLQSIEIAAQAAGCRKLWLVTTNNNPEAATFYVKNGYRLIAVHLDALDVSRKLKPQIPLQDERGISLLDEWEFEKILSDERRRT